MDSKGTTKIRKTKYVDMGSTNFESIQRLNIYHNDKLFCCRYADVIVHRLLAASIGADATYPALLDKKQTQNIANNINYRHRYVSRL